MVSTRMLTGWAVLGLAALGVAPACPAWAQVHDGIDNSPSQQRIADEFRASGSNCDAPACRNTPEGIDPPSDRSGVGAKTPSISAGQEQPKN